jgi:hypothetical protein
LVESGIGVRLLILDIPVVAKFWVDLADVLLLEAEPVTDVKHVYYYLIYQL